MPGPAAFVGNHTVARRAGQRRLQGLLTRANG